MLVKICGLTRAGDVEAALAAGADAIGLNFWPSSKRHVTPEAAAPLAALVRGRARLVGVFVNAEAAAINAVVAAVGLDVVQLHGDEAPTLAAQLTRPLWRAVRVAGAASLDEIESWPGAEAFLLDSASAGYGGSGQSFDWTLARAVATRVRVLVAGGLGPDNVAAAVRAARPWGVDVAGGVETAPGIKDQALMARFIQAARAEDFS
ncbi:MAG: phosphoribosylanthranilate isomerase [Deltaproteobacteria bacterium]|nr:phosphoribosylanthranilate isomerase [Deltaproteobacteria bacterium]